MENNLHHLIPAKSYTPPQYPTRADTRGNPALLKKLPSKWRKNAAAVACIGLLGIALLSGCTTSSPNGNGNDCGWDDHLHHGGSGGAPIYVAHLTE
ncbi:MAG: hypothetical protein FWE08_06715 [Oscillospiraceae bacterium]|nr:hypothetical protein [Oscillospiraceae bacterium]